MAGNSYTSMLSLLQMMLKQQEAEREHQRKLEMQQRQKDQQGGQDQQSSPMDAYNQYTQVMDMMPAATAPAASSSGVPTTGAELTAMSGGSSGLGAEAGTIGAEAGGSGIGGYASYAVPVLAAIAGQHLMSSNTDRRTLPGGKSGTEAGMGHRTGDIFSGDMFTEPWMAFGEQKLGVKTPTAGEQTDAALNDLRDGNGSMSELLSTVPTTGYQWFDPVGNFGSDIMGDKFGTAGKIATAAVLPHTGLKNVAEWLKGLF